MGNTNTKCNKMPSSLARKYTKRHELGRGQFSVVRLCTRKTDKALFAMKITDKRQHDADDIEALYQEIRILQQLRHPNVIDMVEILDGPSKTEMVLELCANGDLQSKMDESPYGVLSEVDAAKIMFILAKTLSFLHKNGVVHRDLKPQNILFTKRNVLKLTDFGMSHFVSFKHSPHRAHVMSTKCGTPYYAAPEIVSGKHYNELVDCWSLGVILYYILSRVQPFACFNNLPMIYQKIVDGNYTFNIMQFENISVPAKNLISQLLTVSRKNRLDCEGMVNHLWVQKYFRGRSRNVVLNKMLDVESEMTTHRQSSLGKLVIDDYIIARRNTE